MTAIHAKLNILHPDLSIRSAHRLLFSIEWTLIAVYILANGLNGWFGLPLAFALRPIAFISIFALLSFVLPSQRCLVQRWMYVCVGMLLSITGIALGVDLELFLYLYIAKSCFLLSQRQVIFNAALFGSIYFISEYWALPYNLRMLNSLGIDFRQPIQLALSDLESYLGGSAFVILAIFAILAEQKSRYRAELLAQQVEQLAADLERARIARDLHDSIGHTLTNLDMQLAVAQKWRHRNFEKVYQAIDTAKTLANQCIGEIDQALQTMRQPQFDLNQALMTLIEQMKQHQTWRMQWDINLPSLPLQTSHQIYCIFKEGLMNIQSHAQASQIWLRGEVTTDGIVLELRDDGQGFDVTQPQKGFGIKGIGERVQLLGGKFSISSGCSQGTKLQIILPQA
ncbi:integral membrane sensor signal transduction histidine kinase [Calothrix sp. PCC 7716]|nr:integral membrane sensor signal transduction histidine kinase [Calothrix sp. PCC 7716]